MNLEYTPEEHLDSIRESLLEHTSPDKPCIRISVHRFVAESLQGTKTPEKEFEILGIPAVILECRNGCTDSRCGCFGYPLSGHVLHCTGWDLGWTEPSTKYMKFYTRGEILDAVEAVVSPLEEGDHVYVQFPGTLRVSQFFADSCEECYWECKPKAEREAREGHSGNDKVFGYPFMVDPTLEGKQIYAVAYDKGAE